MNILFISRVRYGTMGSGALNWFPGYVARAGHGVKVIECLSAKVTEEVVGPSPFKLDVHHVQSVNLFDHLDKIFKLSRIFCPDVFYLFGRSDLYEFVYHLRHRYPTARIVVDIRSPLLAARSEEKKSVEEKFNRLQYYIDLINTCDLESLKTYTRNIFKPVTILPIGVHCSGIKVKMLSDCDHKIRRFVFVGSIYRKRCIDSLVENFISFAKSVGGGVSLDIFGTGDAELQLAEFIDNKSARHYVKMMGAIPQKDLFNQLANYDAGIAYVPYELYSVAPSLKSLEYAAAGIPVFASDTLGHKRYCAEYGFKFGLFKNDKKGFVEYFKSVHKNGFNRGDVSTNLQVVKNFDWECIVEEKLIPNLMG